MEEVIADIWGQVSAGQHRVDDNFFDLGGHPCWRRRSFANSEMLQMIYAAGEFVRFPRWRRWRHLADVSVENQPCSRSRR